MPKFFTNFGSVNLSVKVETEEGKIIEFLILNYNSEKVYPIGNLNYTYGNSFFFRNWMNYSGISTEGIWSTINYRNLDSENCVKITGEDVNWVIGSFSFVAQESAGESNKDCFRRKFKAKN